MSNAGFPELYGGIACLDFANTLDGRATPRPEEHLPTYAALVGWAEYAGLIDSSSALTPARSAPASADAVRRTALELREAIFQVFSATGRGGVAPAGALATVQAGYADAMANARLAADGDRFDWEFDGDAPDRAWWPVAVSATRLLTTGPLDRVKVCASETGCIGLFLDTSKNRSRRWCTMDGCGIVAKVQRQATRRRSTRRRT